MVLVNS